MAEEKLLNVSLTRDEIGRLLAFIDTLDTTIDLDDVVDELLDHYVPIVFTERTDR